MPLAREYGLNTYKRVTDFDFQPALTFWAGEAPFWKQVVSAWEDVQQRRPEFAIKDKFDVPALRRSLNTIQERQQRELKGKVNEVLTRFIDGKPAETAAPVPATDPEAQPTAAQ